jgi:hypothetical protein
MSGNAQPQSVHTKCSCAIERNTQVKSLGPQPLTDMDNALRRVLQYNNRKRDTHHVPSLVQRIHYLLPDHAITTCTKTVSGCTHQTQTEHARSARQGNSARAITKNRASFCLEAKLSPPPTHPPTNPHDTHLYIIPHPYPTQHPFVPLIPTTEQRLSLLLASLTSASLPKLIPVIISAVRVAVHFEVPASSFQSTRPTKIKHEGNIATNNAETD